MLPNKDFSKYNKLMTIPKVIYTYWNDADFKSDRLLCKCESSLRQHNPGYEIHAITSENVHEYAPVDSWKEIPVLNEHSEEYLGLAYFSDILRLHLLRAGGIWVDFSSLWNASVSLIIDGDKRGYFVETKSYRCDPGYASLESFFMAVVPDHPMIEFCYNTMIGFETQKSCIDYVKTVNQIVCMDKHKRFPYHTCYAVFRHAQYLGHFDPLLDSVYKGHVTKWPVLKKLFSKITPFRKLTSGERILYYKSDWEIAVSILMIGLCLFLVFIGVAVSKY